MKYDFTTIMDRAGHDAEALEHIPMENEAENWDCLCFYAGCGYFDFG